MTASTRGSGTLRVLMTADTVGGVWTYALELARALAGEGAVVSLATMGARLTRAQRAEARAVPGLDVHESAYRLEWMDDPWTDVAQAGDWLLSLEERWSGGPMWCASSTTPSPGCT